MNRSFFILKTSCPFLKLFKKKKIFELRIHLKVIFYSVL